MEKSNTEKNGDDDDDDEDDDGDVIEDYEKDVAGATI